MSLPRHMFGLRRRCRGSALYLLLPLLAICMQPIEAVAQGQFSGEEIKAAFLYRFTSYVDWPANALENGSFTIAVQCGDRIADALEDIVRGKQIKGRVVQVRRLKTLSELGDAQMLYVGAGCYANLQHQLQELESKPVLVVTDESSGLQDAGTIDFVTIDGHVRFEVSLQAAKRSNLRISSDLLSVAVRVLGGLNSRHWCGDGYPRVPSSCPKLLASR
jgi:hypothetical protein